MLRIGIFAEQLLCARIIPGSVGGQQIQVRHSFSDDHLGIVAMNSVCLHQTHLLAIMTI